jgi:hypothetical protein
VDMMQGGATYSEIMLWLPDPFVKRGSFIHNMVIIHSCARLCPVNTRPQSASKRQF